MGVEKFRADSEDVERIEQLVDVRDDCPNKSVLYRTLVKEEYERRVQTEESVVQTSNEDSSIDYKPEQTDLSPDEMVRILNTKSDPEIHWKDVSSVPQGWAAETVAAVCRYQYDYYVADDAQILKIAEVLNVKTDYYLDNGLVNNVKRTLSGDLEPEYPIFFDIDAAGLFEKCIRDVLYNGEVEYIEYKLSKLLLSDNIESSFVNELIDGMTIVSSNSIDENDGVVYGYDYDNVEEILVDVYDEEDTAKDAAENIERLCRTIHVQYDKLEALFGERKSAFDITDTDIDENINIDMLQNDVDEDDFAHYTHNSKFTSVGTEIPETRVITILTNDDSGQPVSAKITFSHGKVDNFHGDCERVFREYMCGQGVEKYLIDNFSDTYVGCVDEYLDGLNDI